MVPAHDKGASNLEDVREMESPGACRARTSVVRKGSSINHDSTHSIPLQGIQPKRALNRAHSFTWALNGVGVSQVNEPSLRG